MAAAACWWGGLGKKWRGEYVSAWGGGVVAKTVSNCAHLCKKLDEQKQRVKTPLACLVARFIHLESFLWKIQEPLLRKQGGEGGKAQVTWRNGMGAGGPLQQTTTATTNNITNNNNTTTTDNRSNTRPRQAAKRGRRVVFSDTAVGEKFKARAGFAATCSCPLMSPRGPDIRNCCCFCCWLELFCGDLT